MKNKVIRRIEELCAERNLSLYRLAKISGVPNNTINNMVAEDRVSTIIYTRVYSR